MTTEEGGQAGVSAAPAPGVYDVDPNASQVRMRGKGMLGMQPVRATFPLESARVWIADPPEQSEVEVVVRADGFASGIKRRDDHIRSADYLDAEHHPRIRFRSERVEHGPERTVVHGSLTVRGTSAPAELAVLSITADGDRMAVRATMTVDRYAFGMTKQRGMVGRRVTLAVDAVATR